MALAIRISCDRCAEMGGFKTCTCHNAFLVLLLLNWGFFIYFAGGWRPVLSRLGADSGSSWKETVLVIRLSWGGLGGIMPRAHRINTNPLKII